MCRGGIVIPGVFNAAGLIVPEPSIISPPIPLIEVETGCDDWYIAILVSGWRRPPKPRVRAVAPTVLVRKSARSRLLDG